MKKLNSGRYQIRWRDQHGQQKAKNFKTKDQAKHFESQLTLGLVMRDTPSLAGGTSFRDFAEKWHKDYCVVEKAESQWVDDLSIIRNHLLPAFADRRLCDLTKHDLTELRVRLKTDLELTSKTVNNIAGLAKKMLNTAVDWEMIPINPFAGVRPLKIAEQGYEYWTPEEVEKFLSFCFREDRRLWEIVAFTCHTGLRLGEVQGLKRDCINFERRQITVKRAFSYKADKLLNYTKSKRIKHIPMSDMVYQILSTRRMASLDTFIFEGSLRHTVRDIRKMAPRAGVKPLRFHDLRHTLASWLTSSGKSLHMIQKFLGHARIQETERYAHLHPDHLSGLTDVLDTSAHFEDSLQPLAVTNENQERSWRDGRDLNPQRIKPAS